MKGSYILVIRLESDSTVKTKGKEFHLKEGYYAYVGSAMNSLEKRVLRHFGARKKLHWHIDFLLEGAELLRAYLVFDERRLEERLSQAISEHGEPVEGFGAGDVAVSTNLYRFDGEPDDVIIGVLEDMGLPWKRVKSASELIEVGGGR